MTEQKTNVVELVGERRRSKLALPNGAKVVELPRLCPACDGKDAGTCYHCDGRGRV